MEYKIRFTPIAQGDMDDVWDDVLETSKNKKTTEKYVQEFIKEIIKKKEFPKSGIKIEYDGVFTGIYSVNYKSYKVFYRINEEYIEVLRILHSNQDYMKDIFNDE